MFKEHLIKLVLAKTNSSFKVALSVALLPDATDEVGTSATRPQCGHAAGKEWAMWPRILTKLLGNVCHASPVHCDPFFARFELQCKQDSEEVKDSAGMEPELARARGQRRAVCQEKPNQARGGSQCHVPGHEGPAVAPRSRAPSPCIFSAGRSWSKNMARVPTRWPQKSMSSRRVFLSSRLL